MTLTSHGHHIPETTKDDEEAGIAVARCGGPTLCKRCQHEMVMALHESPRRTPKHRKGD